MPWRAVRDVQGGLGSQQVGVKHKVGYVCKPLLGVSQSVDDVTSYVFSSKGCYMIPRAIECYEPDAVKLLRENDPLLGHGWVW